MDELAARVLRVNYALLALGHEVFEAEGATFVRDRRFARIYDANHVRDITASTPEEIDRLVARADREYAHCNHRRYNVDFRTPPAFEARLLLDGYTGDTALLMVLEGDLRVPAIEHYVRLVESEQDWQAVFDLKSLDWREYRDRQERPRDPEVGVVMARTVREKSPPVRYWAAWSDGAIRGYFSAWQGVDGVGQVEDLFVQREYRHRGLATALMHRCVADARAEGATAIAIICDPTDTPKQMYAKMGFRPVTSIREYRRGD